MFDLDKWQEIWEAIRKNKLRTFLTAFSVAWGVFILIVLLGAGQGLRNGAETQFLSDAINSINIEGGETTLPCNGMKPGRKIQLGNEDYFLLKQQIQHIQKISAVYAGWGSKAMSYQNRHGSYTFRSCLPGHAYLENASIIEGRFINEKDIQEYRKVCVIGMPVKEELFKNESPIHRFIDVEGTPFKVVGVFKDPGRGDETRIYVPLSTIQRAYNGANKIDNIWASIDDKSVENGEALVQEIRATMASKHHFDPQDMGAISVDNWSEQYKRIMSMLDGINIFIWFIGIFTLLAGVIGVSNIMMIVVKERTREIGVRKALGATPFSIVFLIVQEAIFITAVAGYAGLMLGIVVVELMSKYVKGDFFSHPTVNFQLAASATILIVVAGALAGFIPAMRAANIQPVQALKAE